MKQLILKSNAKINLSLEILGKRSDGFHNINSLFIPIDLSDTLEFAPSTKFQLLTISPQTNIPLNENTIFKIIKLIQNKYKINIKQINITLQKKIPIGAGLGGGSSNAATTLLALNEIYNLMLPEPELINLAQSVGSDVPFFLFNKPAIVQGKGEIIQPVHFPFDFHIVLVYPLMQISTKFAYSLVPNEHEKKPTDYFKILDKIKSIDEFRTYFANDFESLLFPHYPILKEIKDKLYVAGAKFASLSGSGSTCLGIFEHPVEQQYFQKLFPDFLVFVSKPLNIM
jgi:4-diphosphocytidyl-2-C-methyl-D-erythritol kinase